MRSCLGIYKEVILPKGDQKDQNSKIILQRVTILY